MMLKSMSSYLLLLLLLEQPLQPGLHRQGCITCYLNIYNVIHEVTYCIYTLRLSDGTVTFLSSISNSEPQNPVGIIIIVTLMCLLIVLLCVTVTRYKGQKLRERLFARRTPLSAVDIHANMYANSVANYYSNNRQQVPPPDKQGDDKDTTSSLDDDFEELPVCPKTSSSDKQEETDYVRVRLGGGVWSQNVDALLRDSEQFGQGGRPLRTRDHASGSGRKSEVGHTSKKNTDKVVKKQGEDAAQSSSGCSEDDDDDDVTYTHVTIKPKHGLK
ncbi:uncharacterized protein LOC119497768 isoform X2 [Sebastes umbrosus]|uniref:uncharacterized protein LOC119497768 isoform X2 n=1 Tax=Sebastes umbrosus TaxID=72105 RepID=UPI00189D9A36|nr:uncharacterized protein LOC119497768 isoform X2 [Sebastes umbrosus]